MNRRLVWIGGGLATVGLLALLYAALAAPQEDRSPAGVGRPSPSAPAAASSGRDPGRDLARVEALKRRLVQDDRLKPPPATASPEEWKTYDETLQAIEEGNDPLKAVQPAAADLARRMDERRKKGQERREASKQRAAQVKTKAEQDHAEHQRSVEAIRAQRGLPPRDPSQRPPAIELPPPIIREPEGKP